MSKYSNKKNISLPIAVWLARDEYDHDDRANVISVTSLLKSVRQIVLSSRVKPANQVEDISTRLASRIGTALHNAVEDAWVLNYSQALTDLGYQQKSIDKLNINPTEPTEGIDVYFEKRSEKQVGNWIVSGQFDMSFKGIVNDVKSTKVFTYLKGTKGDDYTRQLSYYRWLNPEIIYEDFGCIQYIFTDWKQNEAYSNPNYPALPVQEVRYNLLPIPQVEAEIRQKLDQVSFYWNKPESEIPPCSPKELWQSEPQYKYYGSQNAKKASKVFTNMHQAQIHRAKKGKGIIRVIESEPTACKFCSAASECKQYEKYILSGVLKVG